MNITLTSCKKDQESPLANLIKEVPGAEAIYLQQEYEMGVRGYLYIVCNPYFIV